MVPHRNSADLEALPIWAILPGLLYVAALGLVTFLGLHPFLKRGFDHAFWLPALLPWATILALRRSPVDFGYTRRRALAEYGWGMVFGGVWRGASMAFNQWYLFGRALGPEGLGIALAVVLVPLVEETFYRGYLARSLASRYGVWVAVIVQATAFTLHPTHWLQGWPAVLSIFLFGLLAGWLVLARNSIWIALGAHSFANVLPEIILSLAQAQ